MYVIKHGIKQLFKTIVVQIKYALKTSDPGCIARKHSDPTSVITSRNQGSNYITIQIKCIDYIYTAC